MKIIKRIYAAIIGTSILACYIPQAAAADNTAPQAPVGLLTNELERPLNIEGAPAFFWLPQDEDQNEVQTAYEIVVTDALTNEIVWDSEKVISSAQSNVKYGGAELDGAHPYLWQVRTWDKYGERSPYSEPAKFATGLSDNDWNASWIKASDISSGNKNAFRYLRQETQLEDGKTVQRALAYVACCHDYELNINGARIGRGQSFDYLDKTDYQGWDITEAVTGGGSVAVGIIARWYGSGQGRYVGTPGLLGHIKIYYMTTGDRELLETAYPYLKETGNYITRNISSDTGLVTKLAGGDNAPLAYMYGIVDWPAEGRFGFDWTGTKEGARTPVNMLSVRAFDVIAKIAEELGQTADYEDYGQRAAELRSNINERLINPDGVYCDGLDAEGNQVSGASQHDTSYALAFDVVPEDRIDEMSKYIAGMGMKQGPMTADILTEALFDTKQSSAALSLLTNTNDKGWAKLVNDGYTFTWESWEYTNEYSQSHGWGAAAAKQIIDNIAGVTVTEAGAGKVKIAPVYGMLRSVNANVATERGYVGVEYSGKKEDYMLKITVPVNVTAEVELPIIGDGEFIEKNGAEIKSVLNEAVQTISIGSGVYEFIYDGNITEDGSLNDAAAVSEGRDSIVYNVDVTGSGTLITSVYDEGGRFINAQTEDVTGGNITKTIALNGMEKGTVKFMLWSTLENMKPLSETVIKAWDVSKADFVWDFAKYIPSVSGTGTGTAITDEYNGLTISIADNPNDGISTGGVFWNGGASSGESIRYIEYTPATDGTLYATGKINSGSGRWGITDSRIVTSLKDDASSSTNTSETTVYLDCKAGTTYYILNRTRSATVNKVWFMPAA